MLVKGVIADFLVFFLVVVLVAVGWSRRIKYPTPQKFHAISSIQEIVGRCTEINRPLFADPGRWANVSTIRSAVGLAGVSILSYVAKLCATYNTKFVVFSQNEPLLLWLETTMKAPFGSYPNSVLPEVRYVPQVQGNMYESTFALSMERENAGGLISLGPLLTSAAIVAEGSARIGAMSLMGTDQIDTMAFMAVSCDHIMIGEEIFAAAAILSEDKVALNTVAAQDITKAIFFVLLILGAILALLRIRGFNTLLDM